MSLIFASAASAQSVSDLIRVSEKQVKTTQVSSAKVSGGIVADGSFENGRGAAQVDWTTTNATYISGSPIFGPLANPTAPPSRTGSWYAILGSSAGAIETDIMQDVTVPAGEYILEFWLLLGDNPGSDSEMNVTFDGNELISFDINDAPNYEDYTQVSIPVSVATEGVYTLSFNQSKTATPLINFFIDDVSMRAAASGPAIEVAETVDFGAIGVGASESQTISIQNIGDETVTISSITVDGDGFTIDDSATDTDLDAGESTDLVISFSPSAAGAASGTVTIASNDPNSPATVSLTGAGGTPPANDNIADATAITDAGTYTGNNRFATLETGEPVPSCQENQGASVFWAFTPTADGTYSIDLSASDFDTVLTFHQADGTEIACNDDGGTATRSLLEDLQVTAGTTYLIRVAGWNSSEGSISFDLELQNPPRPVVASFDGETDQGPYDRAFVSSATGACIVSGTGAQVMYDTVDFTVSQAGTFDIVVRDFALDAVLAVYSAGSFDPADPCAGIISFEDVNGDAGGEEEADIDFDAGTYTIVVSGFQTVDTGTYSIDILGENAVFVGTERVENPTAFSLTAPRPNPASGVAQVDLTMDAPQNVSVIVYDLLGRSVVVLHEGALAAGQSHAFTVNATTLPAGQYIVRAAGESFVSTQRLTVIR